MDNNICSIEDIEVGFMYALSSLSTDNESEHGDSGDWYDLLESSDYIEEAYSKPVFEGRQVSHRFYHTLDHIVDCCNSLVQILCPGKSEANQIVALSSNPLANITSFDACKVFLALVFHDAIYLDKPNRKYSNEEESAEFARQFLRGQLPDEAIDDIARLIEVTDHIGIESVQSPIEQLIRSIDLIGLSKDEKIFDDNALKTRKEYAHIDDDTFLEGRRSVFEMFMNKRIYEFDSEFFDGREKKARSNIERHLKAMERSEPIAIRLHK